MELDDEELGHGRGLVHDRLGQHEQGGQGGLGGLGGLDALGQGGAEQLGGEPDVRPRPEQLRQRGEKPLTEEHEREIIIFIIK